MRRAFQLPWRGTLASGTPDPVNYSLCRNDYVSPGVAWIVLSTDPFVSTPPTVGDFGDMALAALQWSFRVGTYEHGFRRTDIGEARHTGNA